MKTPDIFYKIAIHFFPSLAKYWDTITPIGIREKPTRIQNYYLDFSKKGNYPYRFDSNGIPLYLYKNKHIYHPTVICQYALGLYDNIYLSDSKNLKSKFLHNCDWIVNNYSTKYELPFWTVKTSVPEYNIREPFPSALVQGEVLSVLSRGYYLTGNQAYYDLCCRVVESFELDIIDGGFKREIEGYMIFEEYPTPKLNFSLNGFIFSLFGLYDFLLIENRVKTQFYYSEGIKSLKRFLARFDINIWSKYSLFYDPIEYPASYKYHLIHINMLKVLFLLEKDDLYKELAEKWKDQASSFRKKIKILIKKYKTIKNLK